MKKRTRIIRRAVLVLTAVMLLVLVATAYQRYHVPAEKKELLGYFKRTFPVAHAQVKSIQAAIAGLMDDSAPAPEMAVTIIDDNILPSIDLTIEQLRQVTPGTVEVRVLHVAYLETVTAMRADVEKIRAVFADTGKSSEQRRYDAYQLRTSIVQRFEAFSARAQESWRAYGIVPTPPAGPATPRETVD